jgi:microsomal dipeptidase-like Zn-dependent dipeptidase
MLVIDLHNHLNLLPQPIPFLLESTFFNQKVSLFYALNLVKKYKKRIIISVALYNVPGIHFGLNGIKHQIKKIEKSINALSLKGKVQIVYSRKDLENDFEVGIVLQLESIRWMNKDNYQLNLESIYNLGVQGIIPIHFKDNWIGRSCNSPSIPFNNPTGGLHESIAPLVFKKCKELKMWLDLSHMSEKCIHQVLAYEHHALCKSHTAVKAIHHSPRAISSENIKKLSERGGVIGISPYREFTPSYESLKEMFLFFKSNGVEDNVSLGTDFGAPIQTAPGLSNLETLINSIYQMDLGENFTSKILWKNAYNFLKNSLSK